MARPILLLAAPTGAGKTSLATQLDPDRFEILSFDSRQIYREMPIGTAAPDATQRSKIRHHLVEVLSPAETVDAGLYNRLAEEALREVLERNKIPVFTAGTGFYLKAFLFGMFPVPEIDPEVRERVLSLSYEEKKELLQSLDPDSLVRIFPGDEYRLGRALEVNLMGKRWSALEIDPKTSAMKRFDLRIGCGIFLDLDRAELYDRINRRAAQMIEEGMAEEAWKIRERYGENCPGLKSLGYNFALENKKGNSNVETFLGDLSQSHRNYAKRQITWFRKETYLEPMGRTEALETIKHRL
ncbi:tRNA (adenosine(37)-N6)-dimethylallyltransferase MiaA [Leptospira gomenensis]|uniref:tRNA dimethylallyltransferase n=1 Tax=Leptospira gomenensis TaxID=2484974 RepID=A0A5F1Z0I0_9LEPT|nr:tRNA (adenosine(37)-N6)-dimethylallyltransferase MiaA [Leptospira gomenensis]TGK30967.1 tRNA (adenosine(37)-N6)-dimethylallyltransferase MiaA [Leptospira gomenensis]TGK41745.1 tRNA (adenosine(37)-N6)-dimethylallyltransferase MiaA [Leptospira gomenensis]TGK45313.1 tRNA (adenosine(37)-N6)-dimethylallyltransferase MiaA [Leptospira gomenensis]TGK66226.1 tRNA (adenosine(37)-N6)-dimethylallyltransferase MiaA [Leptospira gomenensis]